MRVGELCRFSVVADDEAKTIDRNDHARTSDGNVEGRGGQGHTLVRPPSEAVLDSERQRKPRAGSIADDARARQSSAEPDLGDVAHAPLGSLIDNRYLVEALIARGGMGVVYRCRHKSIGKQVAVKVLRKDLTGHAEAPRRLLIEAQAASAIGNEHIIDITDFGTLPNGSSYLVMELLDGLPLSELLASQGTLPLPRVLAIGKQLAEGLMAAHAAGIVHRDLKPENIFLLRRKSDDFVKILDFGIAKMAPADSIPLTRAGVIVGTPDYMSPEQAAGSSIDHRVDIYSLGVILYELAAGRVPFYASNYLGLLAKIMTEPPPPFRALIPAPAVPPEFEGIVLKCLDKRPGGRFQSMQELLLALERVEQLSAPSEEPRSPWSLSAVSGQSPVPSPRSARWGIPAMGATLVLLFSLSWLWYLQRAQPPVSASAASSEALPLPAPPAAPLPEALPAAPLPEALPAAPLPEALPSAPPAVASAAQTASAMPPPELAPPRPIVRKAAVARKIRPPPAATQATPPRLPERLPESVPAAPTPARSAATPPAATPPAADDLLQPWSERL